MSCPWIGKEKSEEKTTKYAPLRLELRQHNIVKDVLSGCSANVRNSSMFKIAYWREDEGWQDIKQNAEGNFNEITAYRKELQELQFMRRDRKERRGGGFAVCIMDVIKFKRRNDVEEDGIEVLWFEIKLRNTNYVIRCAYRAPDHPHSTIFGYPDDVMRMETRKGKEIIMMGDLNCNLKDNDLPQSIRATEFIKANSLSQMITEYTRHTQSGSMLIELLISSTPSIFSRTGVLNTALSDYQQIYAVIPKSSVHHIRRVISTRPWDDKKVPAFQADVQKIPWDDFRSACDINKKLNIWLKHFQYNQD